MLDILGKLSDDDDREHSRIGWKSLWTLWRVVLNDGDRFFSRVGKTFWIKFAMWGSYFPFLIRLCGQL